MSGAATEQHVGNWRVTYIQDGTECCCGDMGADGGEDRSADLSDVSAGLGQQGQQDVHHHLHPLRLLLLLLLCSKKMS